MSGEVRSLGGVPIPVDRRKLNLLFWLLSGSLVFYLTFFNDAPVPVSRLGESLALVAAILLPAWLWVSNRSQGLPIFPFYALFFFPTYAIPLCRGDSRFTQYTDQEIANGVYTIVGYLLLATLIWWQCTNRNLPPSSKVRALDPTRSTNLMLILLCGGVLFELFGAIAGQSMGGAYQALRGYAQNGSRLAIFVLFYQMGRGELGKGVAFLACAMAGGLVIRQAASIVLASSFPILGLSFAGFFLGSGKVPWKSLVSTVGLIILLHSGKAEMRSIYYKEGVSVGLMDYPSFFIEWLGKGVVGLTKGESTEGVAIQSAKERSALLPLLLQIQKMTGREVPYLDGASYQYLPSMLVPRIITKDKAVSHISNMIMAIHYGILRVENVWFTSIAFDLPMEAYANYGYLGVAGLAVVMGLFLGLIGLMTTGVPLFSFRFLMAVLVLSAVIGSNNTMGVFVTTTWQGFLALLTLSLVIMRTIPNPLYAKPVASLKMGVGISELSSHTMAEGKRGQVEVSGHPPAQVEAAPVRHERPKRFTYGEKKA
jgi:hypothetical protein